jgi:hypothetical protein
MDIIIERLAGVASAFLILSLVVEKINDFIKLRNPVLRTRTSVDEEDAADKEKKREKKILARNIVVGVVLALFLKADAIQMIVSGEPGEVVGWENVVFYQSNLDTIQELSPLNQAYFKNLSFNGEKGIWIFYWFFTLTGIFVTGVALSFGSKFWHDILGIIYEVKEAKAKIRLKEEGKEISTKKKKP